MTRRELLVPLVSFCLVAILLMTACGPKAPSELPETPPAAAGWPKDVSAICPAPRGSAHACLVGIGPVIEKYTPIENWIVETIGGPAVWAPLMAAGEADFATHNMADTLATVFLGQGAFAETGPLPVRSVTAGHTYMFMWHTTPKSGIKTLADLEGKRIYAPMRGNPMFHEMAEAQLNSVGLTTEDLGAELTLVSIGEATVDLIEGRIDAFLYPAVDFSVMQINEACGECVFINLTREQADFVAERMPGHYPCIIPAGDSRFSNLSEVKWAVCYRAGLHVRADMDPDVIYGMVKALLEHHDEWRGCHPQAEYWGPEYSPAYIGAAPYHDGAVRYFKEVGLWSDELQANQDRLLKLQAEELKRRE